MKSDDFQSCQKLNLTFKHKCLYGYKHYKYIIWTIRIWVNWKLPTKYANGVCFNTTNLADVHESTSLPYTEDYSNITSIYDLSSIDFYFIIINHMIP